MEKKYFFFDVDNTLLCWPEGIIPDSAIYAIQKLKEAGHQVFLATGRIQSDAARYAKMAGITDFVADGGNSVTIDNRICYMEGLELQRCKDFLTYVKELGIPWAVSHKNLSTRYSPYKCLSESIATWDSFETVIVPDLDYQSLDVIYKIYLYLTEEEEANLHLNHMNLPHVRYGDSCLMYEPIEKAKGIKYVMDYYKAPYEKVVTFGDGRNDVPMFLPIWYNVAMGNSRKELLEVASYVTTDCHEDGILNACRKHGWIME